MEDEAGELVCPPLEELEVLDRLSRLGNMQDIVQRTDYLMELDERYRQFANQSRLGEGIPLESDSGLCATPLGTNSPLAEVLPPESRRK